MYAFSEVQLFFSHLKAEECEMVFAVPEWTIYPLQFLNT